MPVVLIAPEEQRHKEGSHIEVLRAAGFEIAYPSNAAFTRGICEEAEVVDELSVADALIAGSEFITASMLEQLPKLRVIARHGVGFDRVDVAAATERNIVVTITPSAVHDAAAEHTMALLLAVLKDIPARDRSIRAGGWDRELLRPVRGQTLGVLGLGRIGRSLVPRAQAFGMRVTAYDAVPDESFARENNLELVDFETLIKRADVLSVHCPKNEHTTGLLNADVLRAMKPTAIVINTARGPIIDEADLVAALRNGDIAAAGLDVYEVEPTSKDNPLFTLPNVVVLTPHNAGCDTKSMQDMVTEAARNVVCLHRGDWPDGAVVNPELRERGWKW